MLLEFHFWNQHSRKHFYVQTEWKNFTYNVHPWFQNSWDTFKHIEQKVIICWSLIYTQKAQLSTSKYSWDSQDHHYFSRYFLFINQSIKQIGFLPDDGTMMMMKTSGSTSVIAIPVVRHKNVPTLLVKNQSSWDISLIDVPLLVVIEKLGHHHS